MAVVMIGVDPHKGSHTAVVTGPAEEPLGGLRVRACAAGQARLTDQRCLYRKRSTCSRLHVPPELADLHSIPIPASKHGHARGIGDPSLRLDHALATLHDQPCSTAHDQ